MLFLSHAGADAQAAVKLKSHLCRAGREVWLDVDELEGGDPWMETLERVITREASAFAVYIGRRGVQSFVDLEVRTAICRWASEGDAGFRLIPVLGPGADPQALPAFLKQFQWVDLRGGLEPEGVQRLVAALDSQPPDRRPLLPEGVQPFRGLQYFDQEHTELFFGRDAQVEELLSLMRRDRFVAVVGDSGSGKSSLVRAGLIPSLHRGRLGARPGDDRPWHVAVIRPGNDPLDGVVRSLGELNPQLQAKELLDLQDGWREHLCADDNRLADSAMALLPRQAHCLLVVDQFEELFSPEVEGSRRSWFVDSLLSAMDHRGDQDVHVVLTVRSDFLGSCYRYDDLYERMLRSQLPLRPIPSDELAEIIRQPLQLAGLHIENSLVEELVKVSAEEPGHLPLLEFTLLELWTRCAGGEIKYDDYRSIGRLEGAIDRYATSVYGDLEDQQKVLARRAFVSLTHLEGALDTRRRLDQDALIRDLRDDRARAVQVVDRLVDERLLTASKGFVEVAHEALIRHWTLLREWLAKDREREQTARRLKRPLDDWLAHDRDASYLLQGGQLAEVEEWFEGQRPELDEGLVEFLDLSLAERKRKEEAERKRIAELADTNEKLRRLSDMRTLNDLVERANRLWPARPATVPGYDSWMTDAEALLGRLDEHQATLEEIRSRASVRGDESGAEWRFTDEQDAWWHESLVDLVQRLERFADAEVGLVEGTSPEHGQGVARRLRTAREIEERTVRGAEARQAWERALASISGTAECPLYRGLPLGKQLGLIPIGSGPDPASRLWEFALPETGEIPERDAQTGRLRITEESAIVLVLLPGDSFWMGAQSKKKRDRNYDRGAELDEGPPNLLSLDPFFLSKYQVTQAQWARLMCHNPSQWNPDSAPGDVGFRNPVEHVDWEECAAFARRLELELPTEAQWEYACRAGTDTPFHHGSKTSDLGRYANLRDQAYRRAIRDAGECERFDDGHALHAPVGSFQPNAFGLHDMHGNVVEWCQDWYGDYGESEPRAGDGLREPGGARDRVYRGGSFYLTARLARSACRNLDHPSFRHDTLGFRPARRITTD